MLWAYFFNQISNFLRAKLCFKLNLNDLAKKVFGMGDFLPLLISQTSLICVFGFYNKM
jgi:hypothetical protein